MNRYLTRKAWVAALVVAALALAAACGGDRSSDDSAGAARGEGAAPETSAGKSGTDSIAPGEPAVVQGDRYVGGQPSGGESAPPPAVLPSQLDRKIVQVATLQITADNVGARFEDIGNIAASVNGYIASSTFGRSEDQQTASVTIKVPADRFAQVIGELRRLGEVSDESSNANDVTEEFTDLQSRLRNLQATEATYLEFLRRAQNLGEVLQIQDRINATRAEIEQVQGRIAMLQHTTDLATITVHLTPPAVTKPEPKPDGGEKSPIEVAEEAFDASLAVLRGIATVVLAVAAFSWWLLPLAVAGWLLGRRALRERPAGAPAPPPAP